MSHLLNLIFPPRKAIRFSIFYHLIEVEQIGEEKMETMFLVTNGMHKHLHENIIGGF